MSMRVVSDENVATFYIRSGTKPWRKVVSYASSLQTLPTTTGGGERAAVCDHDR